MKKFLLVLFISFVCFSCNQIDNKTLSSKSQESYNKNDKGNSYVEEIKKEQKIYNVLKKTDLYSKPNKKSERLINQKATELTGEVYYLSIDKSCKVKVLDTNGKWIKVHVVEPNWLSSSHIGWVCADVIQDSQNKIEENCNYKENEDYQILYSKKQGRVINFHILLLWKEFDENKLEKLTKCIKLEKSPNSNCNISIYDSKEIVNLIEKYPLEGKDYVKLADHFVYNLSFDGMTMYYPLKDVLYKKYGGKKPIR